MSLRLPIVSCISSRSLDALRARLHEEGFKVYELDGRSIEDGDSFFAAIQDSLPFDPPISGRVHWDALSDSLWGGLAELAAPRVAILWTGVERMLDHGLCDLLSAVDCLRDVAESVANAAHGIPQTVDLFVFLVGEGKSFRPLDAFLPRV
jgi:Barstar (barnase inhibitor)